MSEAPQDTPVISVQDAERISEMALQSALDDLGRIVDGNGLHKSAVRISEKHLKLGQTSVELKFRLSPDLKEERMGGRIPKGEPVKSAEDINDLCAKHSEELYQDPAMQQRMMKEISEKDFALPRPLNPPRTPRPPCAKRCRSPQARMPRPRRSCRCRRCRWWQGRPAPPRAAFAHRTS